MCVCYQLNLPFKDIAKAFKAKPLKILWDPKEKIYPGYEAPVVIADPVTGERLLRLMTWGMPFYDFQKKKLFKNHLHNAKAETITEKKTFRGPFQKSRVLVPVFPSFLEPKHIGAKYTQQWAFSLKSKKPFAFAGIWGKWNLNIEDDKTLDKKFKVNPSYVPKKMEFELFSFITTAPNSLVEESHDRMPVILDERNYDAWLDPKIEDTTILKSLLKPFPAEKMKAKLFEDRNKGGG